MIVQLNSIIVGFLSVAGKAAFCPRVSPDNQTVIWQERAIDAPHNRERNIMGIKIHDKVPDTLTSFS